MRPFIFSVSKLANIFLTSFTYIILKLSKMPKGILFDDSFNIGPLSFNKAILFLEFTSPSR